MSQIDNPSDVVILPPRRIVKRKASTELTREEKHSSDIAKDYKVPIFSKEDAQTYTNPITKKKNNKLAGGINYTAKLAEFQSNLSTSLRTPCKAAIEFTESECEAVLKDFDMIIELSTRMYNIMYSWVWASSTMSDSTGLLAAFNDMKDSQTFSGMIAKKDSQKEQQSITQRLVDFYALYCPACSRPYHCPHLEPFEDGKAVSFYKPVHLNPYRVVLGCGHVICSGCAHDNLPLSPKPGPHFLSTIASPESEAVVRCPLCSSQSMDVIATEDPVSTTTAYRCGSPRCASHISFFTPLFRMYQGGRTEKVINVCLACVYVFLKQRFIDDVHGFYRIHSKDLLPEYWRRTNLTPAFRPFHRNIVFNAPHSYCVHYQWEGYGESATASGISGVSDRLAIGASCVSDPEIKANILRCLSVFKALAGRVWSSCSGFCRRPVFPLHPIHPAWINKTCNHLFCAECANAYNLIRRCIEHTERQQKPVMSVVYWGSEKRCMDCPRCRTPLDQLVLADAECVRYVPAVSADDGFLDLVGGNIRSITARSMMRQLKTRDLASVYAAKEQFYATNPVVRNLSITPMFQAGVSSPFPCAYGLAETWFVYLLQLMDRKIKPMLLESIQQKQDLSQPSEEVEQKDKDKPSATPNPKPTPMCPICFEPYQSSTPNRHPYAFKECGHCICRSCVPKLVGQADLRDCFADLKKIVWEVRTPAVLRVKGTQCPVCRAGFSGIEKSVAMLSALE